MKLSYRLKTICELVKKCNTIADIGTDHGKVPAELLKNNVAQFAYITDISKPSVTKAENLLIDLKIDENRYKVVVTDGLIGFDNIHIDTAIISGMVGIEIEKILSSNPADIDTFILEPNNNEMLLRKYLNANNYEILSDFVVEDAKKFYNVLKVKRGKQKIKKIYLYFGFTNYALLNKTFKNYLTFEKNKCEQILNNNLSNDKQKYYKSYLKIITKSLKNYKEC